uniref:Uncharacterized protein n=1 Tax=Rhizophora mucronata TaxID=61149 RepID=A0A2P2PYN0_RHIMU
MVFSSCNALPCIIAHSCRWSMLQSFCNSILTLNTFGRLSADK